MANVTVPTSAPGVWPAETASIDETVYAQVEADVLRRKQGDLLEAVDARDAADLQDRLDRAAPKITAAPDDAEAAEGDDDVAFTVGFSGDPAPEVTWYSSVGGAPRTKLVAGGDIAIVTDADSSTLTFDNLVLAQDGTTIEVEVRNFKGSVSASATLSVSEAP